MNRSRSVFSMWFVSMCAWLLAAGCGPGVTGPDGGDARMDATQDSVLDASADDVWAECRTNEDCDNGVFCDGEERCVGGRCVEAAGPACDDRRSCTMDRCDEDADTCTHTPDDSMCGDMNACNGIERCDPSAPGANAMTGCTPVRTGNVVDCDDGNNCTIDNCDPTVGCVHSPRDLDGDGHVDRACTIDGTPGGTPGDDCNDGEASVFPGAPEVCDDGRDNNCNGEIDYAESTCIPTNDTCATATRLPGPGTYWGSTVGMRDDYTLGCNGGSYGDAVFEFTTTDVQDVTIATSLSEGEGAVALVSNCTPYSEIRCNRATFSSSATLRLHSLPAGTHRIVVETGSMPGAFRLTLRYDAPTPVPAEDTCPAMGSDPAVELNDGMPHVARLGMLEDDYSLSCSRFGGDNRDAVFRLTLTAPSDVIITATPPSGTFGSTYVSLRNSPCASDTSERRCRDNFGSAGVTISQRGLPAGTYWIVVEQDDNSDVTVRATITSPPAPIPTEDRCPATEPNPAIELNDGMPHTATISALEDDYELSCNTFASNGNDAVFRLTLTAPADVRITATPDMSGGFGSTYMSFRNSPCALSASERRCVSSSSGPASIFQRSIPAGTYWIIVENDDLSSVTVQANITTPPAPTVTYGTSTPADVSFVDACSLPGATRILTRRDDATETIPSSAIPFPVRVYGVTSSAITVSTNGYMGFGSAPYWPLSGSIPDMSEPNLILAFNWTDLYTRSTGICYATTGTAPNRRFIVEWNDLHYCCTDDPSVHMTFEAIINEAPAGANNVIDMIYQDMRGATRIGGAGIENDDGTVGTTITGPFTTPRVIRLTPM